VSREYDNKTEVARVAAACRTPAERALIEWFDEQYMLRSWAVGQGTGKISWVVPEYRVTWSEVCAKAEELGIKRNVAEFRLWWARQRGDIQ
jgi:hypothetical protein